MAGVGVLGVDYAVEQILYCPTCKKQHIDEGEWRARLHHEHRCTNEKCGQTWEIPGIEDKPYLVGVSEDELNHAVLRMAKEIVILFDRSEDLLDANNREVEKRRAAQKDADSYRDLERVIRRIVLDTPLEGD